jgi:hypothetical protein
VLSQVYFAMTTVLGNTKSNLCARPTEYFSLGKVSTGIDVFWGDYQNIKM